jgi:endonuclease YncB( thermonuclease family)
MNLVSGWPTLEISTARVWIDNINQQIAWFNGTMKDALNAENYNRDSTGFYSSARDGIIAMTDDLALLRTYIERNRSLLEPSSDAFYGSELSSIEKRIAALEVFIVTPGVTKKEAELGELTGVVDRVEDGDTFYMGERAVRMAGTDASEGGTSRGIASTQVLKDLIEGKVVTVKIDTRTPFDVYGRVLGVPFLGDQNISLEMVARCMANVNTKFGKHHFVDGDEFRQRSADCVMGWPLMGEMEINSDPPKCAVWIDGKDVQARTPHKAMLTIGLHSVTLFKVGFSAIRDMFEVKEPRKFSLAPYKLQKLGADIGLVEIHANPSDVDAFISVDGKVQGMAPIIAELPMGATSVVSATADGYASESVYVRPTMGRIVKVNLELRKA